MSIQIERMKPLLGTYVAVRALGRCPAAANRAIDAAFAAAGAVHDRMSFHRPDSDVSRMNRMAAERPVTVHPETLVVMRAAARLSAATEGLFDVTVAPELVRRGLLPRPAEAPEPDPSANWTDICLLPGNRVRFRRRLWMDLGGIAKGFAVDRAVETLRNAGVAEGCVNAGGDLRVFGTREQEVSIRVPGRAAAVVPAVRMAQGALASSADYCDEEPRRTACPAQMIYPGTPARYFDSVSVLAPACLQADALTKVVYAFPRNVQGLLAAYSAEALVCSGGRWQCLKGAA